ncbi:MAG: NYN domain-containing protein [Acidimicrobiia bacterium]
MPAPPGLAPYVNFTKLSSTALEAVARVVDADGEFRVRVADAVDEQAVGRPGWLWLTRPEGWRQELARLEDEDRAARQAAREARAERTAAKRLEAVQQAARRAEERAAERKAEVERLGASLAEEQRRRAAAQARVRELEATLAEVDAARAEAVRALKDVEAQLVRRATELNETKARLRALEAAAARPADQAGPTGPAAGGPSPGSREEGAAPAATVRDDGSPPRAGTGAVPGVDAARLAAEVEAAAEGASALARGLTGLSRLLGAASPEGGQATDRRPAGSGGRAGAGTGESGPGTAASHRRAGADELSDGDPTPADGAAGTDASEPAPDVRRPLTLPGGVFDDSPEAADHLLRTPGARVVVDGYNVSMAGWPDLPVAGQRDRLVRVLSEVAARSATPIDVVFDGADVGPVSIPAAVRQLVHVRFSPPGVEADDVVIDLVAQLPAAQPVVVASSDKRVRTGARRQGANVIHARQLLAVARRTGS